MSYNPTLSILLSIISVGSDFQCSLISTHVADAQDRLIRQYKQGSNVKEIAGAIVGPFQQSENDLYELYSINEIDVMEGDNLDRIGGIIGQERLGFSDEDYRIFLKGKIGVNSSRGTLNDIISLWNLFNPNETIEILEQYPAQIELKTTLVRSTQQQEDFVYSLMDQAALAGVNIVWILPVTTVGDGIFKFDSTSSNDDFDSGVFTGTLNS